MGVDVIVVKRDGVQCVTGSGQESRQPASHGGHTDQVENVICSVLLGSRPKGDDVL